MAYGNRIKELREARGLSLKDVARGAETTFQQIFKLETGSRRLTDEWMRRLAPVLGVHPASLLLEFAEGMHSPQESVDEVLLLEAWRLSDMDRKRRVLEVLRPDLGRVDQKHKKRKA